MRKVNTLIIATFINMPTHNTHHILVIDQGTHATRALLFSPQGEILAQAEQTVSLQRIDHEQVEQDAEEIVGVAVVPDAAEQAQGVVEIPEIRQMTLEIL